MAQTTSVHVSSKLSDNKLVGKYAKSSKKHNPKSTKKRSKNGRKRDKTSD